MKTEIVRRVQELAKAHGNLLEHIRGSRMGTA